jgi:hypothetical protein
VYFGETDTRPQEFTQTFKSHKVWNRSNFTMWLQYKYKQQKCPTGAASEISTQTKRRRQGHKSRLFSTGNSQSQLLDFYINNYSLPFKLIPITTFGLGCWQIKRKMWKESLIKELELQLRKPPVDLPEK